MSIPIAMQLYTVRDELEKGFATTLEKVATIGYEGVEFAGFYDHSAKEVKTILKDLRLKVAGSHTKKELLFNDLSGVIKYNKEIGNSYIVCPWDKYNSKREWEDAIQKYYEVGEKLKEEGLSFGYHNHNHEFEKIDDEFIFDMIFKNRETNVLKAEIDTYWIAFAGLDPIDFLIKYSSICPVLHIKDMGEKNKETAEIGEGTMDIKGIINTAKKTGVEWIVVEQDNCEGPSLESARISMENLKKMGEA